MKIVLLILLSFHFLVVPIIGQTTEKPNIIFIVIDDLNDYIEGFDGHPQINTPNIKYLADNGYTFTNTFCNTPVCAPSRTSMLSGKDLNYTQVYANNAYLDEFRDNFTEAMENDEVITLPEHLKNVGGYYTVGVNKVFHDPFNKDYDSATDDPCEKALSWSRVISFGEANDTDEILEACNEGVNKFEWGIAPAYIETDMKDHRAVDSTLQVLTEIDAGDILLCDSAFFIALGFALPHLDLFVPEQYYPEFYLDNIYADYFDIPYNDPVNTFPPNGIVMPPQPTVKWNDYFNLGPLGKTVAIGQANIEQSFYDYTDSLAYLPEIAPEYSDSLRREIITESKRANAIMAYMAGIHFIDAQIGRILTFLDTKPAMKENTIIIIVSDNGFSLGEKYHWMKRSFWETEVRVPLVIYDPNRTGNIVVHETVSLLDLYPTICDITNTDLPTFTDGSPYLDGRSFKSLLDDPSLTWERPVLISWEAEGNKECSCFPQYAVRSDKFKYIRYTSDGANPLNDCNADSSFIEEELYEIGKYRETDPNEWNNVINNPDYNIVKEYLQQWLPDSAMYLKNTFKILIKNNAVPCLVVNTDTLQLSFDLFDTSGVIITPSPDFIYQWTNNLTSDIFFTNSIEFPLQLIPEAVFEANNKIMIYLQMLDPISNNIVAFDTKNLFIYNGEEPFVSFNVVNGVALTTYISDLSIEGSPTSVWWDFGEGNLIYAENPGLYTYQSSGVYTVTCYVLYGNNPDCILSFEQIIEVEINDFFNDNSLYIFPNPTYQFINIFTDQYVLDGMLYIIDVTGRLIDEYNLESNDYPFKQIIVADYVPGVYFVSHVKQSKIQSASFVVVPKR